MLAALGAVQRLCAGLPPAASAQPADPAHLMAPAVHASAESASPHSIAGTPRDSPEEVTQQSATGAETADAAMRAVRESLERAQQATAALADAKRLAEVPFHLLSADRACTACTSFLCKAVLPSICLLPVGLSLWVFC